MECELPAILPCWSLHLPRTAGAPKLSLTDLSLLPCISPMMCPISPFFDFSSLQTLIALSTNPRTIPRLTDVGWWLSKERYRPVCWLFVHGSVHLRSSPLLNSTSMNGIFLSFSRSIVNVILGCCSFRWSNNHASSELSITEMTLSTNRCQIFGGA